VENLLNKYYGHDISRKEKRPLIRGLGTVPWFTYSAIEYLTQFNLQDYTVFEWGSGYSYEWYVNNVKHLTSVESNIEWFNKFSKKKSSKYDPRYLKLNDYPMAINKVKTDPGIIVIDGERRFDCALNAVKVFNSKMLIILDNSDWFHESAALLREKLNVRQIDFHGFGPQAPITWTTSFFIGLDFNPPLKNIVQPHPSRGSKLLNESDIILEDDLKWGTNNFNLINTK
jgi:hypothetical protein